MKKEIKVNISFTDEELAKFVGDRTIELKDDQDYKVISYFPSIGEFSFRVFTIEDKKEDEKDD